MKTVKNTYHKKLLFPLLSISIAANATKTVSDTLATAMIANKWIELYDESSITKTNVQKDDIIKKDKGRK